LLRAQLASGLVSIAPNWPLSEFGRPLFKTKGPQHAQDFRIQPKARAYNLKQVRSVFTVCNCSQWGLYGWLIFRLSSHAFSLIVPRRMEA